jgi:TonB-dependent receptor
MRQPKQTAISLAAVQLLLLSAGAVHAQTAATNPQTLDTVVVKGQRAALEKAQERKQNADEIIDSVDADEAGKLPDKSITEVLQRVVGVTVQRLRVVENDAFHFSEEGSGIRVRGLGWGSSNLNGREIFSAGWPGKDLSWGAVPTELMVGVDVYKNPSAERIEGAISGLIDLRTAMPFDYPGTRALMSFGFSRTKSGQTGSTSPQISGLYTTQWDTDFGKVGVLVDIATNRSTYSQDFLELAPYYARTDVVQGKTVRAPNGVSWGSTLGNMERKGFYGALQWRKNDWQSGLTFFFSKGRDEDQGSNFYSAMENPYKSKIDNVELDDQGNVVNGHYTYPLLGAGKGANQFVDGGIAMGNSRFFNTNDTTTSEWAWNVKWKVNDRWTVNNDLQWVNSKFETNGREIQIGTFMPSIDISTKDGGPVQLDFDDKTRAFLANENNYYWNIMQPKLYKGESNLYAWKADAKFNFDDAVLRDFRFGVRISKRDSVRKAASYASDPGGTGWKSLNEPWAVPFATKAGEVPKGSSRVNYGYINAPGSDGNYTYPTELYNYAGLAGGRMGNLPSIVYPTYDFIRDFPNSYNKLVENVLYQECVDARVANNQTNNCVRKPFDSTLLYDQQPKHTSNANLTTAALYGTLRFGFDDWAIPVEGNAGVRAVYTGVVSHGYVKFDTSKNYENAPASLPRFDSIDEPMDLKHHHIDVLPSLNLKANFTEKLQGRLSMARSVYRPDFKQLQETITLQQKYDSAGTTATYTGENSGNVGLKPMKADSFDLSLEWYPKRGQSITSAVFYKKLKDIIYDSSYTRSYNTTAGVPQTFVISGPDNLAQATLKGFEISADSYLDHFDVLKPLLPGWLKGLGVSANFTRISSDQKFYRDGGFTYCPPAPVKDSAMQIYGCDLNGLPFSQKLPMKGVPKRAANFALRYDYEGFSMRLAYNWNDRSLLDVRTGGDACYADYCPGGTSADPARAGKNDTWWGLPRYQEAFGQWDLGGGYTFSNKFGLWFNVSNLNNVMVRNTYQQTNGTVGTAWRFPGQSYGISGRMEF